MTPGLRDPGRRRATVLAALLQLTSLQATVPTGGAQTCTGKTNITFSTAPGHDTKYERHEHAGVRSLVGWLQRHLAAMVLREPTIPEGLLPLNDTYDAETKEDIGRRNTCGCFFTVCFVPLM
ncbi:hypothetical protein MRX96_013165 [Rhipicephalus microplus]